MSTFNLDEAAEFGMRLTKDQQEMIRGGYRYALVGQIMPVPHCCEDPYDGASSLGVCEPGCQSRKGLVLPTVMEVASPEERAEWQAMDREWRARRDINLGQVQEDVMPDILGWPINLSTLACDMVCECKMQGDFLCDCYDGSPSVISPYAAVPIDDDQATELVQAAYRGLTVGALPALQYLAQLQNHGLDYAFDLDLDLLEFDRIDSKEYQEAMDKAVDGVMKYLQTCGEGSDSDIHITRDQVSYLLPESLAEAKKKLALAERKALVQFGRLFRRDPYIKLRETRRLFAYPTYNVGNNPVSDKLWV